MDQDLSKYDDRRPDQEAPPLPPSHSDADTANDLAPERRSHACEAALRLADIGWPVFPVHTPVLGNGTVGCSCGKADCSSVGKHPRTKHGLKDATTDTAIIEAWWQQCPDANISVATGAECGEHGVLVLDVDAGSGGRETLAALEAKHGVLPTTVRAHSGGGGEHLYFGLPQVHMGNWVGVLPGLDIRTTGSCIIVPPSLHRSGGTYRWAEGCAPWEREVAEIPGWLVSEILASHEETRHPAKQKTTGSEGWRSRVSRRTLEFLNFGAAEGQRNASLFAAACDMSGAGATSSDIRQYAGDAARRSGLKDSEITSTIESALRLPRSPSRPSGDVCASVGFVSSSQSVDAENYPVPMSLPSELSPVEVFDVALLPETFREWITDIAERAQCPVDFPAVAVMVALSAAVGRRVGIRPKRHDDWTVVPNLWGMVIGRPGVMKSVGLQEPLKPLKTMEALAKEEHEEALREQTADRMVNEASQQAAKKRIKAEVGKNNSVEARRLAMESLPADATEPTRKRYIVNDPTVEKLGEILKENPNGVLLFRDEMIGFLKNLDKDGQEGARSFYLEAWNGTGGYSFDRIGRGTLDIPATVVSILGGIQPGPLAQYQMAALKHGSGDDGLLQRLQLMVWPDVEKDWEDVDRVPNAKARATADSVFEGLASLDPELVLADHDAKDLMSIPVLRFDAPAQEVFSAWRANLEAEVRGHALSPAMESHLAKYRSLVPSMALLIHLADGGKGPVGVVPIRKAIGWAKYLRSHAQRVFTHVGVASAFGARQLLGHIQAGELQSPFAVRDVYRRGWTGLSSVVDAKAAASMLAEFDWLIPVEKQTEGRTGRVYVINPRAFAAENIQPHPPDRTDRTDERGAANDPTVEFHDSGGSVTSPQSCNHENSNDRVVELLDDHEGGDDDEDFVAGA